MNRKAVISTMCAVFMASSTLAMAEGSTVKVTVKWQGKPYKAKRMKNMNKECTGFHAGKPPRKEKVVTNENGTLANVFVYVKNAPKGDYPTPSTPAKLDQKGCVYTPHVLGVMVGQDLQVVNSDPTAHNVHFTPKKNKELNKSQPKKGLIETLKFKRAEIMVPVKCDVHPWMSAFVGVMDHPFFGTTRAEGTVTIDGLPGGQYKIIAWHEKYGEKELDVTVATGETKEAEITYSRKDKK